MRAPDWRQVGGSALGGAIGFTAGFYVGLFVVLGFWGLEFDAVPFVVTTGGLASLLAGGGIASTVKGPRRIPVILTALVLGAVLVLVILSLDGDVLSMAIGGAVLVSITSLIARSGKVDALARLRARTTRDQR